MNIQDIRTIGIGGAGTMGSGIAQLFAASGYRVRIVDIDEVRLERSKQLVALYNDSLLANGLMTRHEADQASGRISYHVGIEVLRDAELIVESVVEKLDVKQSFWREVEIVARPEAILATNTSGLSINQIGERIRNKARFLGMHFWNPPHIIPLVELTLGEETEEAAVDILRDLSTAVGKKPVVVRKDVPGFIGNRLQFAVLREALHIVAQGIAVPEDVDCAMKYGPGFRYPILGPLETADLGGLDVFSSIASYLFRSLSDMKESPEILTDLVKAEHLGVKSGRGFYDYSGGKDAKTIRRRDEMLLKMLTHIHSSRPDADERPPE